MELRFSGRLNFTQAMASRTSTATVSASVRSLMSLYSPKTAPDTTAILYSSTAPHKFRCRVSLPISARMKDPLANLAGYVLRRASAGALAALHPPLGPPSLRPPGVGTLGWVEADAG